MDLALPVLIRLKLWFRMPVLHHDIIDEILREPAVNLRELTTNFLPVDTDNLFSGQSPMLTTLSLATALPEYTVHAFSAVRNVTIELAHIPVETPLAAIFPSLRRLFIYTDLPGSTTAGIPDLRGLRLDALRMQISDTEDNLVLPMETQRVFPEIRHICFYGMGFDWPSHPAFMHGITGDLDVRVHGSQSWSEMTVYSSDVGFWRSSWFTLEGTISECSHPLSSDIDGFTSRIRTLRLDLCHLDALWSISPPLSALHSLRIDISDVYNIPSPYCEMNDEMPALLATGAGVAALFSDNTAWLQCAALDEVLLVSTHPAPALVKSREVALLGFALGGRARRPKLVLAGLSFTGEDCRDLLDQVFSAVELRDFPGWEWDGGHWSVCLDQVIGSTSHISMSTCTGIQGGSGFRAHVVVHLALETTSANATKSVACSQLYMIN
ncbi:hypothetical protein AURDEDRAFT_125228 [Auricularia subglabra TFB-10046 SS5]|nr:hypothetical protein AURDEDRAFT_125228 [Auricularia subglabra TFB-10046 SS5]